MLLVVHQPWAQHSARCVLWDDKLRQERRVIRLPLCRMRKHHIRPWHHPIALPRPKRVTRRCNAVREHVVHARLFDPQDDMRVVERAHERRACLGVLGIAEHAPVARLDVHCDAGADERGDTRGRQRRAAFPDSARVFAAVLRQSRVIRHGGRAGLTGCRRSLAGARELMIASGAGALSYANASSARFYPHRDPPVLGTPPPPPADARQTRSSGSVKEQSRLAEGTLQAPTALLIMITLKALKKA
ncbi:hypothetical protein C0992_013213 [Termitomyces sp. T32_za158]|nr:hypothetical protein C0992_013213 [Termitomyces sp. T32_za158]